MAPVLRFLCCGLAPLLALAVAPRVVLGQDRRNDLAKELRAEYAASEWPKAIATARAIVALDPNAPGGWYDLACVQSRAGESEAAVASLRESATRGFDLVATLLRDQDLDAIREAAGFAETFRAISANHARSLETFKQRAWRDARVRVIPRGGGKGKGRASPATLIVALHGRGGDADSFVTAFAPVATALAALLVVPEGMEKMRDGGFGWGKVEEGEHLVLRAIELAKRELAIDPARIVVVGFSQGGAAAITMALRHPESASGVVVVAAGDDPRIYSMPTPRREVLPRFALLVGGDDPEAEGARALARRLEQEGARVGLRVEAGLGHALPRDRVRVLANAIRFALGERESLED